MIENLAHITVFTAILLDYMRLKDWIFRKFSILFTLDPVVLFTAEVF